MYIFYFLLSVLWFLVLPVLYDPFELPKVIFFICATQLLLFFYIFTISNPQKFSIQKDGFPISWIAFIAICVGSSLLSPRLERFWGQPYRYQGILLFSLLFVFAWLVSKYREMGISLTKTTRIIARSGLVSALLIIVQALLYWWGFEVYSFGERMTGLIGNPNFAAGFLVLSYGYCFFYFKDKKVVIVSATLVWLIALLLTGSRGGLLAFALGLMLLGLQKINKKFLLLLLVGVVAVGSYFLPQRATSHFDSRTIIWQKGVQAVWDKPVLGWGLENFDQAFQSQLEKNGDFDLHAIRVDKAHNEFLEIAVATGVVGLLCYCFILIQAGRTLWKNRKNSDAQLQFWILCIFCVLAQFNILSITEYIFLFIALGVSLSLRERV